MTLYWIWLWFSSVTYISRTRVIWVNISEATTTGKITTSKPWTEVQIQWSIHTVVTSLYLPWLHYTFLTDSCNPVTNIIQYYTLTLGLLSDWQSARQITQRGVGDIPLIKPQRNTTKHKHCSYLLICIMNCCSIVFATNHINGNGRTGADSDWG